MTLSIPARAAGGLAVLAFFFGSTVRAGQLTYDSTTPSPNPGYYATLTVGGGIADGFDFTATQSGYLQSISLGIGLSPAQVAAGQMSSGPLIFVFGGSGGTETWQTTVSAELSNVGTAPLGNGGSYSYTTTLPSLTTLQATSPIYITAGQTISIYGGAPNSLTCQETTTCPGAIWLQNNADSVQGFYTPGGGGYIAPDGSITGTLYGGQFAAGVVQVDVSSVAPVPVPAAAWLMLSGLGGLGLMGRKRSRQPST